MVGAEEFRESPSKSSVMREMGVARLFTRALPPGRRCRSPVAALTKSAVLKVRRAAMRACETGEVNALHVCGRGIHIEGGNAVARDGDGASNAIVGYANAERGGGEQFMDEIARDDVDAGALQGDPGGTARGGINFVDVIP